MPSLEHLYISREAVFNLVAFLTTHTDRANWRGSERILRGERQVYLASIQYVSVVDIAFSCGENFSINGPPS
jgi:hypothetical protein